MLVGPSTVEHSGYFRDAKTGALREFDVHATFRKHTYVPPISFEIHVIAECKASAPSWVLYMASDTFGARDWDFETFFETSSHAAKTVRNLSSFRLRLCFALRDHTPTRWQRQRRRTALPTRRCSRCSTLSKGSELAMWRLTSPLRKRPTVATLGLPFEFTSLS